MADIQTTCPVCSFTNAPQHDRCQSCGARLELLEDLYSDEELASRRSPFQQDGFDWKWTAIACVVFLVLQAVILVGLPFILPMFDPQGLPGLMISAVVWFFGGIAVGYISPGKTFVEPAAGALIAVPPTIAYLVVITPQGFQPSLMAHIVFSLLGVMVALFGAYLGERFQMGSGPRAA